jgi:hypothetical protein
MRIVLAMVLAVVTVVTAGADDGRRRYHGEARTDLFLEVPLDHETGVVFPFGGSHHAVPGVVTINRAPYFCRPHHLSFRERAPFVEHLVVKHGLTDREIPGRVLVERNQVRYVGD